MCGIAGIYNPKQLNKDFASSMIAHLSHRGPDAINTFLCPSKKCQLAHSRLSIIDLSQAGSQPMFSQSKNLVISFNGEIYNHHELRDGIISAFPNYKFNGSSDTESLISYIDCFGLKRTLEKIRGQFAFALWNFDTEELILARDPFGEKPIYYGRIDGNWVFASELKAISNTFNGLKIDNDSLKYFLKYNCIPSPLSIYQGIKKVNPGSYVTIKNDSATDLQYFRVNPMELQDDLNENAKILDSLFNKTIQEQMVSDVPLGAFLSGGVDSSLICAYLQSSSSNPIKTFSVGFKNESFDEAPIAKKISNILGTDHYEIYPTRDQIKVAALKMPSIFCEPFSDSSQIPTYLVSQLAKSHVTVSLSGDAGDELFGGYNRYLFATNYWNKLEKIPFLLRNWVGNIITTIPSNQYDKSLGKLGLYKKYQDFGKKLHKFAAGLTQQSLKDVHNVYTSHWSERDQLFKKEISISDIHLFRDKVGEISSVTKMMESDMFGYLTDDNLCKLDRTSMSVSLESRVPFLDPRIVNFSQGLPLNHKIEGTNQKVILHTLLGNFFPKEFFNRPKSGFAIPIHEWMFTDLKDWIGYLIYDNKTEVVDILDFEKIEYFWQEFLNGNSSNTYKLWDIISLLAWFNHHRT